MTTTFTNSGLWEGQAGDPAIKNAWAPPLVTNFTLLESMINGTSVIDVTGQTAVTLTVANGAPDQRRELVQQYIGAPGGNCTVSLPNVAKYGWAQNSTTGGFSILLSAGAGADATIPPDGQLYFYAADGATNVILVPVGLGSLKVAGALSAGTVTVNGVLTVTGTSALKGGITGVTDGSNAAAGTVGEFLSVEVLESFPLAVGSGGFSNVAVLSLTAGDWDVWGNAGIVLGAGVTCQNLVVGISTVSAAPLGSLAPNKGAMSQLGGVTFTFATLSAGMMRVSLNAPANVWLVIFASLSGAAILGTFGFMGARRVR